MMLALIIILVAFLGLAIAMMVFAICALYFGVYDKIYDQGDAYEREKTLQNSVQGVAQTAACVLLYMSQANKEAKRLNY